MKVDVQSIDQTQFVVDLHSIGGENCYLVTPQRMGVDWTQENKVFRSSLWNAEGVLISAGFPKFVNWGEKPEVFPLPNSLKGTTVMEKLDGSLLIVSRYRGQYIIRTRGTVDATKLDNGHEIELFKSRHSSVLHHDSSSTWDHSLLFEWTSPENRIVIDYGVDPKWKLIGLVYHDDYSLAAQQTLDFVAHKLSLERPKSFTFNRINELLSAVELWKNAEGVCVYSNGDQEIHKCKSLSYLKLHRFKESATLDSTVELFVDYGYPEYQTFEAKLVEQFNYECFMMVRGFVSQVVDAFNQVREIEEGMKGFADSLRSVSRKDAAAKVLSSYGQTNRANFVFTLLDGKPFGPKEYTKLIRQCLKE